MGTQRAYLGESAQPCQGPAPVTKPGVPRCEIPPSTLLAPNPSRVGIANGVCKGWAEESGPKEAELRIHLAILRLFQLLEDQMPICAFALTAALSTIRSRRVGRPSWPRRCGTDSLAACVACSSGPVSLACSGPAARATARRLAQSIASSSGFRSTPSDDPPFVMRCQSPVQYERPIPLPGCAQSAPSAPLGHWGPGLPPPRRWTTWSTQERRHGSTA